MMKPTAPVTGLIAALALAFGTTAMAQTSDTTTNPAATPNPAATDNAATTQRARVADAWQAMRVSRLMGKEVRNAQGQNLGEIQDVVVDVNNDEIYYAVLSFGGFMGMGDKLFAYPVRVFKPGQNAEGQNAQLGNADYLVLNVDKQKLKDAPGFESKRWPNWNRDKYRAQVDQYYGDTVALNPKPNMLLRRASNLIDADVKDQGGNDIGEVKDLVVDMQTGKVRFAAVDFDEGWGKADQWSELPLRVFRPSTDERDELVLRVSREQIATAPGFPANRWPNMEGTYRSDVDAWFTGLGIDTTAATDRPAGTGNTGQQQ